MLQSSASQTEALYSSLGILPTCRFRFCRWESKILHFQQAPGEANRQVHSPHYKRRGQRGGKEITTNKAKILLQWSFLIQPLTVLTVQTLHKQVWCKTWQHWSWHSLFYIESPSKNSRYNKDKLKTVSLEQTLEATRNKSKNNSSPWPSITTARYLLRKNEHLCSCKNLQGKFHSSILDDQK